MRPISKGPQWASSPSVRAGRPAFHQAPLHMGSLNECLHPDRGTKAQRFHCPAQERQGRGSRAHSHPSAPPPAVRLPREPDLTHGDNISVKSTCFCAGLHQNPEARTSFPEWVPPAQTHCLRLVPVDFQRCSGMSQGRQPREPPEPSRAWEGSRSWLHEHPSLGLGTSAP